MTAEDTSPIEPTRDETSDAANDNGASAAGLLGPISWQHERAPLELAAALGAIAADLWLAGTLEVGVHCGHNRPRNVTNDRGQE